MLKIYTIGHSNRSIKEFVEILVNHNINCVIDVRSIPYSKYNPQFNKESLFFDLKKSEIEYVYLGEQLGARRKDNEKLYSSEGHLDFEKVKKDSVFLEGIDSVMFKLIEGSNVVIMCSEKNPSECHRSILIGYKLKVLGLKVIHICDANKHQTQEELENSLLNLYFPDNNQIRFNFNEGEMFSTKEEMILEVYKIKNREIGYRNSDK